MTINWEEQWELFAPGFKDGCLTMPSGVRLLPGAGFGDHSHQTTQLMVNYLPNVIQDVVVDVGCGSGILSLNAKALGAKTVIALDICPDSIEHTRKNAQFNQMEFKYSLDEPISRAAILMNMIFSEQQVAWESLPLLHQTKGDLVISGLLKNHRKMALDYWSSFNWKFEKTVKMKDWILIHLKKDYT